MTALAELLLAFEHLDRDVSSRLTAGTPRAVLIGTVDAKLVGTASLKTVAEACGLALGTLKAARSRVPGLREAMDGVGHGPREWRSLNEENTAVARFWRERTPEQRRAWIEAFGCETVHPLFDAHEANDHVKLGMKWWKPVPARPALERLWGESAPWHAELIDIGHSLVDHPAPWMREAVA